MFRLWRIHFATHCNAEQKSRNAATRCVLRAYNAAKCDRWGRLQRSPDLLAGFKRSASWRGGKGEGREGKGRGRAGKGRRGVGREGNERGGEVDSDAHLEQGRRLANFVHTDYATGRVHATRRAQVHYTVIEMKRLVNSRTPERGKMRA